MRLSRARKYIECASGFFYVKWYVPFKDTETFPEKALVIIKCACLLHNLIEDEDGDCGVAHYNKMQRVIVAEETHAVDQEITGRNVSSARARQVKELFTNHFCNSLK
jgi:hypothetical protein